MKKRIPLITLVFSLLCACLLLSSCVVEETECRVVFVVDGNDYHTTVAKAESKLAFPTDPYKAGFVFEGWYTDENVWQNKFTEDYFLTNSIQNLRVFAKFLSISSSIDPELPDTEGDDKEHTHTPGEPTQEDVNEATCTVEGSYTEKIYCTDCGELISSEEKPIEKAAHAFSGGVCECGAMPSSKGLEFEFNENDNAYTLVGIGDCTLSKIVVDTYDNLPVTFINYEALSECESIKELVIGKNVAKIGSGAFYGCTSLESVQIEEGVTEIGAQAFRGCVLLKEISIPSTVTVLEYATFSECRSLSKVELGDKLEKIDSYVFDGCENIYTVTIPKTVKSIDSNAFAECLRLFEVYNCSECDIKVGDFGLEAYGKYPYNVYTPVEGKSKLTIAGEGFIFGEYGKVNYLLGYTGTDDEISLPLSCNGKEYAIHRNAFYNMSSLVSVTIPVRVTAIGDSAFYGCTSLEELDFNAESIPDFESQNNVFYHAGKDGDGIRITVGAKVKRIPANMFFASMIYTEAKVKSLSFKSGSICTEIGENAFRETGISDISIPPKMKKIGSYAFSGSDTYNVLYNAESLEDREDFDAICGGIAADTKSFTVTIGPDVVRIPDYAFARTNVMVLNFDKDTKCRDIGASAFGNCLQLAEVNFNAPELRKFGYGFVENDEYPFTSSGREDGTTVLNISADVVQIPDNLFCEFNVAKVVFEKNSLCHTIGRRAFFGASSLVEIEFPDSIRYIEESAFSNCEALVKTNIPSEVISVSTDAFSYCDSLLLNEYEGALYLGNETDPYIFLVKAVSTDITDCEIHTDARFIACEAFEGCTALVNLSIPDTIQSLGAFAFEDCKALPLTEVGGLSYLGSAENPYLILFGQIDYNMRSVYVNSNTKFIYTEAFAYSTAEAVVLPNGLLEISAHAFTLSKIENIVLPSTLRVIGPSAFFACDYIKSITIPGTVRVVGAYAFDSCEGLESVVISEGVKCIELAAFSSCPSLKTVVIADSVELISYSAFSYCDKLENVVITNNSNLKLIEDSAFKKCSALRGFFIPETVVKIGVDAFLECDIIDTVINMSEFDVKAAGTFSDGVTLYDKSKLGESLACTDDGFLFLDDSAKPHLITYLGIDNQVVLPDDFNGSDYVIESYAFYLRPDIVSVKIPEKVSSIEKNAFELCTSLSVVIFEATSGWIVTNGEETVEIPQNSFTDYGQVAQLLKSKYKAFDWMR